MPTFVHFNPFSNKTQNNTSSLGFQLSKTLPQKDDVVSIALSPDGNLVAVCSTRGVLTVWSLERNEIILTVGETGEADVSTSSTGQVVLFRWAQPYRLPFRFGLICAYARGHIQALEYGGIEGSGPIWYTGKVVAAHDSAITSLCVDKSNTYFCTVSREEIKLWYVGSQWDLRPLSTDAHELAGEASQPSPLNGSFFCYSYVFLPIGPKLMRAYNTVGHNLVRMKDFPLPYDIHATMCAPDDLWVLATREKGGGHYYSLPNFDQMRTAFPASQNVQSVDYLYGHDLCVYGDGRGSVQIRSFEHGRNIGALPHHARGKATAQAVSTCTLAHACIIASATTRSRPTDPPTVKIWINSVKSNIWSEPLQFPPVRVAIADPKSRWNQILSGLLRLLFFACSLKFACDTGILMGKDKAMADPRSLEPGSDVQLMLHRIGDVGKFYVEYLQATLSSVIAWLYGFIPTAILQYL
ncbi:hypothetical protein SISSUDRAFT_1067924 [Sistotremastrum suecicum HHB10207 ss-3]|uniref:Uncharacterized protein n=1 Tax=Sistotremastrum suecicum HHB10207 ss-3 TaxID=1314776 RepID=A0A165WK38_9AGAM|nr:hypothetical protein SISSUDRAFT_1067924 [Sistotremastrum suecicum HHB10207 ss-3]